MEPRIQYAKTSDGVSIAFWTMGEGEPLVYMPRLPFSHIQMEWQNPDLHSWFEHLAAKGTLVRYDARGTGLSDRDAVDFSLDAQLLDLEAVADCLGLDRFALFGVATAGPAAITYAARRPERISHLLLYCAYARASDFLDAPTTRSWLALLDKNWELFTESISQFSFGWSGGESAHRYAAMLREGVTESAAREAYQAFARMDATDLLPRVGSPTLVMHLRQIASPSIDAARAIATVIPNARLALLEGEFWFPITDALHRAIDEFLGEGEDAVAGAGPLEHGAFRTVLFTDVEGSTALTERLGDARARELLREHERIVREALKSHGGSEVKTMGDGFMTSFSSATRALECAIAIQRRFAERNESAAEPIKVRIGLNAGEPIAEDDPDGRGDLFGTAVNVAARIAAKAEGGEILAADVVRQLVAGKGFLFADRGDTELRGFEDPVRVYEVRWRAE